MPRQVLLPFLLLIGALMTGCSSTSVSLKFVAIEPVNELQPGESRPVDIRVYQLRDDAKFKTATVDEIWENDKAVLADHLIDVKLGTSVFPEKKEKAQGMQVTIEPLSAECRFLGVLALYRQADEKGEQKLVVPVGEAGSVTFELTGNRIAIRK
ncbi:MAG: type VI secretion system lipoprotein TssJ [Planctomycetes bacterium]|jgi:type VI secretion system protein VasD|nr:type VI secretion system lipoprotein TssJ [Planctomycetota bacterium]MCL4730376.1 type VI secretion system lipoprotein TssJ [Planctomycetota bacterium]